MADPVAFPKEASEPDELRALCSLLQVLVLFKDLTASNGDKRDVPAHLQNTSHTKTNGAERASDMQPTNHSAPTRENLLRYCQTKVEHTPGGP